MRHDHELRWLLEVASMPTAAGREQRVMEWIRGWVAGRPDLAVEADEAGNLVVRAAGAGAEASRPLFLTAHLDHPALVVERVLGPATLLASFRGGVLEPYFRAARVRVHASIGGSALGTVIEYAKKEPFPECQVELDDGAAGDRCRPGDVAVWDLPAASVHEDEVRAPACDDLSAVAAALAALDRVRGKPEAAGVRVLFTRAEEVGFIGAIAACRLGTIPKAARIIALENSRSFEDSPIVRVGDRISTFSPALTSSVAKVAEALASREPGPGAERFRWQRKLMPGGACEASAYQAFGYEATCVCLPLGNYHNMADLSRVQAGDEGAIAAARVDHEVISRRDYGWLIDLLEACAVGMERVEPLATRLERVYAEKAFVLR
jgi:endoglucanase